MTDKRKGSGRETSDPNPFSFKNFVGGKTSKGKKTERREGEKSKSSSPGLSTASQQNPAWDLLDLDLPLDSFDTHGAHSQVSILSEADTDITVDAIHSEVEPFPDVMSDDAYARSRTDIDEDEEDYYDDTVDEGSSAYVIADQKEPASPRPSKEEKLQETVKKLKAENKSLALQIVGLEKELADKTQRFDELKNELEFQSRKEADDTRALEKMVQQVEENLISTTKRAITAENAASKMKQEIKSLQGQVKSLKKENDELRTLVEKLKPDANVDRKAADISQKLNAAADSAEMSLKTLLKGVDDLKLMAKLVADVTKIREQEDHHLHE